MTYTHLLMQLNLVSKIEDLLANFELRQNHPQKSKNPYFILMQVLIYIDYSIIFLNQNTLQAHYYSIILQIICMRSLISS